MALTLQRFANGDTNYIAKHNANADGLEAAVNGLQTQLASSFGASISIGDALLAIFGGSLALIGSVSYTATTSGSTLTVGPGYLWRPETGMVQNGAGGALNFSGVAAGTYYVVPDATGVVTRATSSTGATHSVVWSGSSFTSVTRTAAVFLNASDDSAALVSSALGATYANLDARLEAGETIVTATESEVTAARTSTTGGVYASLDARLEAIEAATTTPVSQPFDVHTFFPGIPTTLAKLYRGKLARAVTFPADFANAQFSASANATASTVFDIQKNGSSIGSCTIAAGSTTPTFASSGGAAQTFAAGDLLSIIAPATPDTTLADPALTLAGTR